MSGPNQLTIAIFKGSPLDASRLRHVALFIRYEDYSTLALHVIGPIGFFDFQVDEVADPIKDVDFIEFIPVADLAAVPKPLLVAVSKAVSIQTDADWNCQNWVGDALKAMLEQGWITREERLNAIDRMVEIVLEAPDED